MSSPFPGVDPYVEAVGLWEVFHPGFLTYCRDALNEILPGHYAASIGSRLELVNLAETESLSIIPDVLVSDRGRRSHAGSRRIRTSRGMATLEPVRVALPPRGKVEVKRLWIEILRLPGHIPVTVIELLSPTNKMGEGFGKYLRKRRATIRRKVHLVEIDLLLGGERLPMGEALPPGDFYALVSRSEERPESDVYAWTIRDPLPIIPIPLQRPDPDVPLDLASGFAQSYDRGRFAILIDYAAPPGTIKKPADRTWAERTAKAARR